MPILLILCGKNTKNMLTHKFFRQKNELTPKFFLSKIVLTPKFINHYNESPLGSPESSLSGIS